MRRMVQPTVETRSQDLRLDDHAEQILKIKATMNEIRTIQDREREEEREFQKAMLTWMKQQDPEFFSDISTFPDSIVMLLEPVIDDAPKDMSSGISDFSCTSPVTHVPMNEGFVCFSGGNSTLNTSEEVESFPGTVKNIDYQEQIQNTNLHFEINGTSPNSLRRRLQLSVTGSMQHGWNSTSLLDLGDDGHDCHDIDLERDSKTPLSFLIPPSSPPPPPLPPGIDVKHRGTMMESKRSSWEKTTPFNNRLEWGYLGYPSNGLKNDNWAAIDSWGSQLLNRKIDWVLTSKQNISPLVNKATDQCFVNWNENNHVYPNQLPSPSPTPAMAYVFQQDRRVRSSSRTEWKERKKKDLSFHGGSQVGLFHKCHKCKEGCDHYAWDANQASVDQLSKKLNIRLGSCSIEAKSLVAKYGDTGLEWLTSFGKVIHNWDMSWMQFVYNDVTVHLQGLGTPQCSLASCHSVFSLRDKSSLDGPSLCDLLFFVWEVNCHHIQKLHSWFKSIIGAGLWFSFIFNQGIGMSSVENVCGQTPPPMGMQDVPGRVRVEEVIKEGHEWDDFWKRSNVHPGSSFLPPDLKTKAAYEVIPMFFLVTCTIENRLDQVHKWLIHWKGQPDGEATREVELNLNIMSQFPEASLEDKTCFEGVSNDTNTNMVIKRANEPKLLHA
ncbi:unnamed protein product [Lactuca saligna]|uniref:Uncharacterized protein n=1 Tax=Lactuca saligna TaxID=75948 RepID=A0AA35ZJE1_LACSI|nr:unnamed protein product [Lactuca saligna]